MKMLGYSVTKAVIGAVMASVMVLGSAGAARADAERDRLEEIDQTNDLSALKVIERLWKGYAGIDGVKPVGISAFPSMHLCMATLNMAYAFRFGRLWGWSMVLFTAATLVGSVHLGWHYLVDGIAGIAFGLMFWAIAVAFARRWHRALF